MSFVNVPKVIGQLGLVSSRLAVIAQQAAAMPPLPYYGPGSNKIEPSSTPTLRPSDIFQNPNAPPPTGFERSPTGGNLPTGMGPELGPVSNTPLTPLAPGEWRSRGGTSIAGGRVGVAWGEPFSPEQTLLARGQPGEIGPGSSGPVDMAAANALAERLQTLADRVEETFGEGSYFAAVLKMEIPYLKIGARSAEEASAFIQAFAPFFLPGLQQALTNPTLTAEARNLIQDAIRTAMTGVVGPAAGALGVLGGPLDVGDTALRPGPRLVPPLPPGEGEETAPTTAARIGAAVRGVGEQVAGLGATLTKGSEQQADRVLAGVAATITRTVERQTSVVHAAVTAQATEARAARTAGQEANRRLAEQFSSIHGWQQRVETGYLRPVQEGIVRANRELAEQFRASQGWQQRIETGVRALGRNVFSAQALRDELERLNFSGRLGVS